ncbi:hypothetical protein HpDR146_13190 [Helicobacter pylori]
MITEYFYILLRKSKEKSFLQQNLQTNLKKNPFYNKSQAIKSHFFRRNPFDNQTKQPKLKKPPFL